MKTLILAMAVSGLMIFSAAPLLRAETTVTVQDDNVLVDQDPNSQVTVRTGDPSSTVSSTVETVEYLQPISPVRPAGEIRGEIVLIDYPKSEIVVYDPLFRGERRVKGDPSIVATLKTGDRVRVELRGGSGDEASRIIEI